MGLRRVLSTPTRSDNPYRWLLVLAGIGLALRVVAPDHRAIHFDEARIGIWILRYLHTGDWLYRPALHGPFLFHVARALFAITGPSDVVLRLPVAVVGGLLPLAAWLYRDHLADVEVIGLGVVFTVEPFLVYYSRFARSDLLVAAFMVVTLGCWLRLRATGRARYLYAGTAALGLGIASKENALLYLLCWLGAAMVLPVVHPPLRARLRWQSIRSFGRRVRDWAVPLSVAAVELLVLISFLFAPRMGDRPLLDRLLTPSDAVAVVDAAVVGSAQRLVTIWVTGGGHSMGTYALFLGLLVGGLLLVSSPLVALAAVGVVAERTRSGRLRPLLWFSLLWAGLSIVGYPYATDIMAGWTVVHVVVPATVPAAVGATAVWRAGRTAPRPRVRRWAMLGLAVGIVLTGTTVGLTSYVAPGAPYNPVGQPGQATHEFRATMGTVESVAARTSGTDVGYYGPFYAQGDIWRLPFEWYLTPSDATVSSLSSPIVDPPPVVIALDVHAETLEEPLDGYVCVEHDPYPWAAHKPGGRLTETVIYVDRAVLQKDDGRWKSPSECGAGTAADRPIGSIRNRIG